SDLRFLHPLPGRRDDNRDGQEARPLECPRRGPQPPGALALAPRLRGSLRRVHDPRPAGGVAATPALALERARLLARLVEAEAKAVWIEEVGAPAARSLA